MLWKDFLYMEGSGDLFVVLLFIGAIYLAQLKEEGVFTYYKHRLAVCLYYHLCIFLYKRDLKKYNLIEVERFRKQLKRAVNRRVHQAKRRQRKTAENFHRDMAA